MNFFNNLKSGLLKAFVICMTASAAVVSCYDDSELREQIDLLADQLYELEEKLTSEIKALNSMLTGKAMITDLSTDASTGITTVKLSDGNTITLLPEKDLESYITYMTLGDGKDYWAYIDGDGKQNLFLDENERPIPVLAEMPEIVEGEDGEPYLLIGGVMYPLSGNSVFSDYELIKDELTGEVYAVTFTFGEDMTFTVTVDGACGFHFVMPSAGFGQMEYISDYFVSYGHTEKVQIDARGVVDYVLQIPDGWRVKESEDIYMGTRYFDITAPSKELVESGVAVKEGELKVVAVLEGGKATVAKLYLTTEPFKSFGTSLGKLYVEMNNGLQKYVLGVCSASAYDEETIFGVAEGLLTVTGDYPAGYDVLTSGIAGDDPAEYASETLVYGEEYLLWAIPASYYMTMEDSGYYLEKGSFVTFRFTYYDAEFKVTSESYRDAEVSLKLNGADKYYSGLVKSGDYMLEDVLYSLNNTGVYTAGEWTYGEDGYAGSVFDLFGVEAEPQTEYVAWVAVAEDGRTYTERDLMVCGFSTLCLVSGGTATVAEDNVTASAMNISVTLKAEGAESVYYAYLPAADAKNYADDDAKAKYLFENGKETKEASVVAVLSDFVTKVKPETSYVLWAVASSADGKYGKVLDLPCKTTELVYNDLSVELKEVVNEPGNVVISISAEGAEDYLYWVGKTSDNTWKSSTYLGGSKETAQAYMYMNPEQNRLVSVMEKYPVVDGLITMDDLEMEKDYVIVAMAKDKDGLYSKAEELRFKPRSVYIGTVVSSSDTEWAAAKPTVEWYPEKSYAATGQMPGQYVFDITVPEGFTAYVLAGTDAYLTEGNEELVMTAEERIIKIIQLVDSPKDVDMAVDYDKFGSMGYPYGFEFYHYEHGCSLYGNVVIWANREFHDSLCDCGGDYEKNITVNGVELIQYHVININDGKPLEVRQPYAIGSTMEVIDKVFVVCQDLEGNCYEPFVIDVPVDLFANGGSREDQ